MDKANSAHPPHIPIDREVGDRANQWIARDDTPDGSRVLRSQRKALPDEERALLSNRFGSRVHFDCVACGPLVVASSRWRSEILALKRHIMGVEMEIFGVMHAAFTMRLPCLAIKGVSDLADEHKNVHEESVPAARDADRKLARKFAAEASARVLIEMIKDGVLQVRPDR